MATFGVTGFTVLSVRIFGPAVTIALLVSTLFLSSCGRRSAPPITTINDEPAPPAEGLRQSPFNAVAEKVRPAVAVLATFDERGKLIANEHAFFISADGDLLAERTAMSNAASAVVKAADGHAYDTLGTYIRSSSPHFILLKTNARNVPYLRDPRATAEVAEGAPAAVVLSASGSERAPFLEGKIAGRKNDDAGEWLAFDPPLPETALGAPVVDASGAIIGIVAQRSAKDLPAVFRYTGVPSITAAEISRSDDSEIAALPLDLPVKEGAKPPAPSPSANSFRFAEIDLSKLQGDALTPSPFATPKGFFIRMNPNWRIHAKDRPPSPSLTSAESPAQSGKLVFTPRPRYSSKAGMKVSGSGNYRVTFNAEGKVSDVQVTRTAGGALDAAAVSTLRTWRAEPGRQWTADVPIKF